MISRESVWAHASKNFLSNCFEESLISTVAWAGIEPAT
jgi:hypothetical protein